MNSMLPIISMTDLQRRPKECLDSVQDYAVIQSHGKDRAFVLNAQLGRILLETGMLAELKARFAKTDAGGKGMNQEQLEKELKGLIGNVLKELSKK